MARIIESTELKRKLNGGLIDAVNLFDKNGDKLSLQVRDNYCNIYYRGGNILRVKPKSFEFDPFYFHTEDETSKKDIMGDAARVEKYTKQRDELIKHCVSGEYALFFEKASDQMDRWLVKHPKGEREEQHKLILANMSSDSQYYIIDIEFAVSDKSSYCNDKYTAPRFDIVAIDKSGQLWIFELKKGKDAIEGPSGIKDHLDKFNATVGGEKWNSFVEEIKGLLENKIELKICDQINRQISQQKPKFAFLFKEKSQSNNDLQKFKRNVDEQCPGTPIFGIDSKNRIIESK